MAEVTQLKRYDARPINWGQMVSDWHRDAGFGVHPAGADDLHLRAGIQQGADAGFYRIWPIRTCCTPSG